MPRPMVWRERNRPWRMAAPRPCDIAAAHQNPISGNNPGPGPHRAPGLGPGSGRCAPGLPDPARADRPYRHDERRAGGGGGLAAGCRMGLFLHCSKALDRVETQREKEIVMTEVVIVSAARTPVGA